MRIAVDVDGVLAARIPALLELAADRHGTEIGLEEVTDWNVTVPDTGRSLREFFAETDEDPEHLLALSTVPGAVEGMKRLAADHTVYIATYRKAAAREPTERWLRAHDIPFDGYVREVGDGKREVPAELLVDDSSRTAATFADHRGRALLFRRPWNAGSTPENVTPVDGWKDVLDRVSAIDDSG